jgi:hypothetical protein
MVAMIVPDVEGVERKRSEVVVRTVFPIWIVEGGAVFSSRVCATQPVCAPVWMRYQLYPLAAVGPAVTVPVAPVGREVRMVPERLAAARRLAGPVVRTVSPTWMPPVGTVRVAVAGDPAVLTKNSPAAHPVVPETCIWYQAYPLAFTGPARIVPVVPVASVRNNAPEIDALARRFTAVVARTVSPAANPPPAGGACVGVRVGDAVRVGVGLVGPPLAVLRRKLPAHQPIPYAVCSWYQL